MRRMIRQCLLTAAMALLVLPAFPRAESPPADEVKAELLARFGQAPLEIKGGRLLRFEAVDRHLAAVTKWVEARSWAGYKPGSVQVAFGELFRPERSDALFPLTNSVIRLATEESLAGLPIRDEKGISFGTYRYKYTYSRMGERCYTLFFFQYETPEERLQQTGNTLLLDRYLALWTDLKDRVILSLPLPDELGRYQPDPVIATPALPKDTE